MLEGAFLLTILFTKEALRPVWNPWGPYEFSTYQDCLTAGEVLSGLVHDTHITCASKKTGKVHADWSS